MLSRLIFGLALGLLMYMPRPRGPESGPPPTLPPGVDGPPIDVDPPGGDGDWTPVPSPIDPPIWRHPRQPSVPPTPPPGHTGPWPPNSTERPDVPPTPPPGFEGEWPGHRPTLRERILDFLRDIGFLDGHAKRVGHIDAKAGAKAVDATEPAGS